MSIKETIRGAVWIAVAFGVLGLFAGIVYGHWMAYFQRFPNAAWWTFFFQGRH
jgi:hypothetical protein